MQELAHGNLEGQVQLTFSEDTRGNSTLFNVRHVMQMPKLTANLFKVPHWSVENKKCLSQKQSWDLNSLRGRLTFQLWKEPENASLLIWVSDALI